MSETRGAGREAQGADGRFDAAIDRAVREMLDVEPPADLRAKVISRVSDAAGKTAGAPGFRLPSFGWALTPLVAAALILVAVFVARRSEPIPQAPVEGRGGDRYLTPEQASQRVVEPPRVSPADASPAAVPSERRERTGTIAAADSHDVNGEASIAPLRTIAPIAIASIAQETIVPSELAVRELTPIGELQIAPLTPPDRRN